MSIAATVEVWNESSLKGGPLLLLLAIADCADEQYGFAWPGEEYLAKKARVQPRQVRRSMREIETTGEVQLLKWKHNGKGRIATPIS